MEKYTIYWGLLDDNEVSSKIEEFESESDADDAAYELACKEYDSRPLRTVADIMIEDELSEDEATNIYNDEREDGIEWWAEVEEKEVEEEVEEEELLETEEE